MGLAVVMSSSSEPQDMSRNMFSGDRLEELITTLTNEMKVAS
jgi:hypothetical protein